MILGIGREGIMANTYGSVAGFGAPFAIAGEYTEVAWFESLIY